MSFSNPNFYRRKRKRRNVKKKAIQHISAAKPKVPLCFFLADTLVRDWYG